MPGKGLPGREVFTVGHSTRALDEFVSLLQNYEIRCLVDVRTVPKSRRFPHFNGESLAESLQVVGIEYRHESDLGGWRRPAPNSPNGGWQTKAFQGYADHMSTPGFRAALGRVTAVAAEQRTAIMCAEAVWWRCHRRLISDALVVEGWRVRHIGATPKSDDHEITPFALVDGELITYPPAQGSLPTEA